jgi:hypothetical protein
MKTRLILKPGQRGTKGLAEKYGDDLLCVRFRYDVKLRQRLKTVELIVERTAWTPPKPRYYDCSFADGRRRPADAAEGQGGRRKMESGQEVLAGQVRQYCGNVIRKAYIM